MIAYFKFKNFFSIKTEQCLTFEPTSDTFKRAEYCIDVKEGVQLSKIGIIYGANASGKTNILMAISFFRDLIIAPPKVKTEEIEFMPFLLDNDSRNERTEMSMSFYLNKCRYFLSIEFDNEKIYSEKLEFYPGPQPASLYIRTYNIETNSTNIKFGGKLGLSKKSQTIISGHTINNSSVLGAFGKSNIEASELNTVYDFFSTSFNDILSPETALSNYIKRNLDRDSDNTLKPFLIKFLKASDFNISDFELSKEEIIIDSEMEKLIQNAPIPEDAKKIMVQRGKITNSELLFKHTTDNGEFQIPENVESRGTIRLMGMAIILKRLLMENSIITIDEGETSLHYELLSYFLKVFLANCSGNSQLIMTTHNIDLLDEDYIRRDVVWFTDKDSCGETKLTRLSSFGLHKNLSPYNTYKQGKLVKLPFLGNIYLKTDDEC